MELTVGQIVRSSAGRDKEMFFIVMDRKERYVFLCDGKKRPLSNLKKKKDIHVKATRSVLSMSELKTDKAIRRALHKYAQQEQFPCKEGGC